MKRTPYVTHRTFNAQTLDDPPGRKTTILKGTKLYCEGELLRLWSGQRVALRHSQNGIEHFARNDDGNGLERGALTYAIAWAPRNVISSFRFSENEQKMICTKYSHWLEPLDRIIFNNAFYDADIETLREFAQRLGIKR